MFDIDYFILNSVTKRPVSLFKVDIEANKAYEEFYVTGEKVYMNRFQALGVVEQATRHDVDEVNSYFSNLEGIFHKDDFTKSQVVEAIKEFMLNFEHEEKGMSLDQKM